MTLLSTPQAANLCRTSTHTLEAWRRRHEGPPFIKVGRLVRYSVDDLTQWLQSQRQWPRQGGAQEVIAPH